MTASAPSTAAIYSKLATNNPESSSNDVDNGNGDFELSFLASKAAGRQDDTTLTDDELKDENDDASLLALSDDYYNRREREEVLQLWRLRNLAVPLCYFMVGLVQGLMYPLLNIYPLDLGATEAQQQTIWFLKGLPSSFKIVFGLWSDNVPIMGYRRKPYMIFGWAMAMIFMGVLVSSCDLTMERTTDYNDTHNNMTMIDDDETQDNLDPTLSPDGGGTITRTPPENAPSIPFLSVVVFLWANGVWIADVMGDSLVAEKAKYERPADRGNLQAICYCLRGLGMATMAPVSSLLYATSIRGPSIIVAATGLFPLALFPFLYHLYDTNVMDARNSSSSARSATKEQLQQLWKTACSRAVWQPMGFVYIYMAMFVSNAAWREFLKSVLGFTPNQLNALLMVAGVLAFVGLVVYKYFLMATSWRTVFVVGIVANGLFSFLQLLLVWDDIPLGLSHFLFSLGDDAVRDFLLGTQYLPICVMMVNLVPSGIEGASYALFTTTWNVAAAVSDSLSTALLTIWDVSKETLLSGDLTGLTKLTLLTAGLQVIPIFFVGFVPHSVADLKRLQRTDESSTESLSWLGGAVYLTIVFVSILFAIFVGIMNVVRPGWMGES
jgi:hypothetical protein